MLFLKFRRNRVDLNDLRESDVSIFVGIILRLSGKCLALFEYLREFLLRDLPLAKMRDRRTHFCGKSFLHDFCSVGTFYRAGANYPCKGNVMSHIAYRAARYFAFAAVAAAAFAVTVASAQNAAVADLGKAWPNAQDMSSNPNWHAYVFEQEGVRYIQINDRNGTVRAAIGLMGNTFFALPMGADAKHVYLASKSKDDVLSDVVYQDDATVVTAVPQDDGAVQVNVRVACQNPAACTQNSMY
jgi:hypothetical protein